MALPKKMVLTDAEILEIKSEFERVRKTSELDEEHMKVSFHSSSLLTVVVYIQMLVQILKKLGSRREDDRIP